MPSHDHAEADPVAEFHDNSWSADLEREVHAEDRERLLADARRAIDSTASGYHVNLVTHGEQGHPETYLFDVLDGLDVEYEYVSQCGCGGHVTRVHV